MTGGNLADVPGRIPDCRLAVITDKNVSRYYRNFFPAGLVLESNQANRAKHWKPFIQFMNSCWKLKLTGKILSWNRRGVVCDLAGFVASTYLRGVRFDLLPPPAGTGGCSHRSKNGVDYRTLKT